MFGDGKEAKTRTARRLIRGGTTASVSEGTGQTPKAVSSLMVRVRNVLINDET